MLPLPEAAPGWARCGNCGFLAKTRSADGELLEVKFSQRKSGEITDTFVGVPYPSCALDSPCFDVGRTDVGSASEYVKQKLIEEIVCPQYWPHHPLHTPKEHVELKASELLRIELASRDTQREKDLRDWQAQQKKNDQDWHVEQKKDDREWQANQQRINRQWAIGTGLFIAVASGIIGWLVKPESLPKEKPAITAPVSPSR